VDPPHILATAEARDLKFCIHIVGWVPNKNYAKVGHRWSGVGSCDILSNFGTPFYLGMAEARYLKFGVHIEGWEPCAAAFAKLLWLLVSILLKNFLSLLISCSRPTSSLL